MPNRAKLLELLLFIYCVSPSLYETKFWALALLSRMYLRWLLPG